MSFFLSSSSFFFYHLCTPPYSKYGSILISLFRWIIFLSYHHAFDYPSLHYLNILLNWYNIFHGAGKSEEDIKEWYTLASEVVQAINSKQLVRRHVLTALLSYFFFPRLSPFLISAHLITFFLSSPCLFYHLLLPYLLSFSTLLPSQNFCRLSQCSNTYTRIPPYKSPPLRRFTMLKLFDPLLLLFAKRNRKLCAYMTITFL